MNVSDMERKNRERKERETERIEGHFVSKQKKSFCGHNDGIILWTTTMTATRVKLEKKKWESYRSERTKEKMFGISKAFINNKTKRDTRNEKWQRKAILFPDIRNALSKFSYSPTSTKAKFFFCMFRSFP